MKILCFFGIHSYNIIKYCGEILTPSSSEIPGHFDYKYKGLRECTKCNKRSIVYSKHKELCEKFINDRYVGVGK